LLIACSGSSRTADRRLGRGAERHRGRSAQCLSESVVADLRDRLGEVARQRKRTRCTLLRRRRREALNFADRKSQRLHGDARCAQALEDVRGEELKFTRPDAARRLDVQDATLELHRASSTGDSRANRALPLQEGQWRALHAGRNLERERGERLGELERPGAARPHGATSAATNDVVDGCPEEKATS
jgi:hypothetical protein